MASILRKKKEANNESLGNDGIMINVTMSLLQLKEFFLFQVIDFQPISIHNFLFLPILFFMW